MITTSNPTPDPRTHGEREQKANESDGSLLGTYATSLPAWSLMPPAATVLRRVTRVL